MNNIIRENIDKRLKENRKSLILAAVVMLIPVIVGICLWGQLPDLIATHFDYLGNPDTYSSKFFAIFGLNGILYGIFALCILATLSDPKSQNINQKVFSMIIWIVPFVSVFANSLTLGFALGKSFNIPRISKIFVSLIIIVCGNFLPKSRQSYTVGIKLPWTLASEDNWNRTHRFAGKLWIVCGLLALIDALVNIAPAPFYVVLIITITIVPTIYSYVYYKNHPTNEEIE